MTTADILTSDEKIPTKGRIGTIYLDGLFGRLNCTIIGITKILSIIMFIPVRYCIPSMRCMPCMFSLQMRSLIDKFYPVANIIFWYDVLFQVKSRAMEMAIFIENEDGVKTTIDAFYRHLPLELPLPAASSEKYETPNPMQWFFIRIRKLCSLRLRFPTSKYKLSLYKGIFCFVSF